MTAKNSDDWLKEARLCGAKQHPEPTRFASSVSFGSDSWKRFCILVNIAVAKAYEEGADAMEKAAKEEAAKHADATAGDRAALERISAALKHAGADAVGDVRRAALADAPRRACRFVLDLEADTRDDLASTLFNIATRLERGELTKGVSGGYSSGYIYELVENDSPSHDEWARNLRAWIDRREAENTSGVPVIDAAFRHQPTCPARDATAGECTCGVKGLGDA